MSNKKILIPNNRRGLPGQLLKLGVPPEAISTVVDSIIKGVDPTTAINAAITLYGKHEQKTKI